ncbi:PREDICTED: uncharacterized protein LOC109206413 [Nicotiana attenuata]|uniref:RING-type domain-containing protein n=1 Tax=Nicotiana attenuata TaxID=49451 RepID=A0A314KUT9_NICAT|nr:PREDICTED: uncharacterized protein LOC109206413 [Nicotiana attenuata]OIT33120.1 hypothetical protein A4A49_06822 [Nicotiana attenuata]
MASSQVEIASSSPFGYVLNRIIARDSNSFQENFKNLVQNHADLFVHKTTCDKNENNSPKKRSKAAEKWDKARNMVFSMDKEKNKESCVDVPNLGGVSSLVRKWKDFANNSENSMFLESPHKGFDESDESCIVKNDSFGGWESEKTDNIDSNSVQGTKDSDITESERLKVSDIIKKLTYSNGDEGQARDYNGNVVVNGGSLPRVRTTLDGSEQQQRCCFSPVVNSPRFIRGRQAFSDLLLQMERDRHREIQSLVERKAVSKFQQRGRIQALLRVRLIRRGAEVRDDRSVNCSASESNRLTHSAIMHLREKFNTVGQHRLADSRNNSREVVESGGELGRSNSAKERSGFSTHQQREEYPRKGLVKESSGLQPGVANSRSIPITLGDTTKEVVDNILKVGNFCSSNQPREENQLSKQTSPKKIETRIHVTNSSKPRKEMAFSATNSVFSCGLNQHDMDLNKREVSISLLSANPQSDWEEETTSQHLVESDSGWVSDYSHTASGWDEIQSAYQQQVEGNEDWISNVSRPRREWEGLRHERYQEMLDRFIENHDIQQLLHRKSVSNFLTSGLREKIDRIMASRSQQLPNAMRISHDEEEELPTQVDEEEEEDVVLRHNARKEDVEVEEEQDSGYDDEDEVLIDDNTSSWSLNQVQEVTDDSYHFPSPSSLQSQSSSICSQRIKPCSSSSRNSSTEMELIYELRGHMEKLHQEIFEIRRSMKSCMNMQMKLQRSIKQDVTAAIGQLGQKNKGNSDNKVPNKGNCCICCEEPVDSLLYRCGHMCTCFKCAHELLRGTGKCPICRDPIMDVVRAYAHS